ncbi:hypothetical protein KUCAC02_004788, partial [Chaenocephalus aceratus]
MKQNLVVSVKDNGQPSLSATCSMYLLISDNLAEVPELKDISYDEKNSKLTSYLIIALVSVSTFFLTFIIIILGVRFCRRRKPRLLFDGAVAIPSAYLPPNYADVDGTGTLRSAYNYDAYLTTGSRTSDFKFVSSYNDNTLPADQTLRKSPSDFAEVFGDCDSSPEYCLRMRNRRSVFQSYGFVFFFVALQCAHGDLSYSVQEELKRGSVIGNIANDLGLEVGRLAARKARVDMEQNDRHYCGINLRSGDLIVEERIDREEHCGEKPSCVLKFDLLLESPLELHRLSLQLSVADINDNPPVFEEQSYSAHVTENNKPGSTLCSVTARDPDWRQNGTVIYSLLPGEVNGAPVSSYLGEIRTQRDISESDSMKQNLVVSVKDNGQPSLSATCSMYLLISDNLAEVPELKDISYDEKNSKLTSYLIIALVSVSTFFLTFIIIILGVRFCRRRKPRLLFDGAVAIPSAYLPPNYADVDGTGTLRSAYNYDAYLTTGSRTSDFKFVSSYNDNTLPADQTLRKNPSDFAEVFGDCDSSPELSVADINDNPPVFEEQSYSAHVTENNKPGSTLCSVTARDPDWRQNGTVIYSLLPGEVNGAPVSSYLGEIRTQRDISESDSMKQNLVVSVKDNGQPSLSATCSMYLLISDNLAEVPELKDISYDEKNSKLTSYLIIALVSVSTFFLTFIIIILGVRFCRRRKPRLLFDGAVAIPSAYLPPNYADVDRTGTLRSAYNYDAYLTTGSRTSDFKFVSSYNDNTLPADQTLRKSPSDFAEVFGDCDSSPEYCLGMRNRRSVFQSYGFVIFFVALQCAHGDLSYSVQEELKRGSVIGNIAKDLGLEVGRLAARKARVDMEQNDRHYCGINLRSGDLIVEERIDREEHCGEKPSCVLKFDLLLESPLELHRLSLQVNGAPVSSYLSVNGDMGVIHAILYPAPEGNSFMTELVPKAAHGGSLVSKVIAVDSDSGQNAWLSYHIVKSTDPGLFTIGLHSGEIRTQRDISESDSMKQNLVVSVKDNGQPSLSATCSMYLLISDNLTEVPELKDISYDEKNSKLTSYLIIALVRKPRLLFDGAVAIPSAYLPPNYADVDGTGTLRSAYNYDAYLTTGSRTSDFKFVSSSNDNTLPADQTLRKSPSDFAEVFGDCDSSPEVNGAPVSSYLSVNGDTGVIHAVRTFDYEQFRSFKVHVMARDNGSPPLSSNVTVSVFISDVNDNSPQILYPAPEGNSFMTELVPKAAHGGSLVSKVIAVDADSGQNAWLSYHIVKSTDPGLFTIGLHSGEIRTQRDISESDSMKQNLVVSVKDNGQPPLSATCSMYLLISDNLAEVPELKDISYDEKNSKLTSYLIIALVSVSTFFLTFIIIILGVRFCRRRKPRLLFDGAVAIPSAYLPPNYADVDGTGTLRSAYNYDAYLTTGSRTSDFKFVSSSNDNTLPADQTLRKSPSDFAEVFGDCDSSPEYCLRMRNRRSVFQSYGFVIFFVALQCAHGDLSYSVQEELKRGSVIGNIAKDLGLEVQDINDNSPIFPKDIIKLEIRESADKGANGEIRTQRDISESDSMKQNLVVSVKDNGQPSLSATCSMYLLISDNLAEVPELKDISYDEKNSKLTSYLIIALVRKPRLLFDGAVAIPSAYLPPNYADVDGTGTLRSAYNYDAYLTTGSRTSDFKFVSSYNDNTLPADQTLRKSPSDFAEVFGDCDSSPEVTVAVRDVNDNTPIIYVKSLTNPVPENMSPGSEVGIINVQDADSENNQQLSVADINDNPPVFEEQSYSAHVTENNKPGSTLCSVTARDPDWRQNGTVIYSLLPGEVNGAPVSSYLGEIRTQRDISESDSMKQNLVVSVKDNGQPSLSATCSMYLLISDNLAEVPELKDISYDEKNSKLTSYLIIALVSVSTFFLTFIIIILGVRFCRRRKPRLLFDGAVAIPSAYLPPNYADVDGTGTLRSAYNYDAYLTTGSRTSDFRFVSSSNDNTLPADQTLRKSPSDFAEVFGDCDSSPE